MSINIKGLAIDDTVLFLYREDADRIAFAREMENAGTGVVVAYNDQTPDNIWRLSDELMEYSGLYYVNEANTEAVTDDALKDADEIIIYIADHDNKDEILSRIKDCNPSLSECTEVSTKDMWTLYRLSHKG